MADFDDSCGSGVASSTDGGVVVAGDGNSRAGARASSACQAGWFPDPLNELQLRFFAGGRWTEAARPADGALTGEVEVVDPAVLAALPAPGQLPRAPFGVRRVFAVVFAVVLTCLALVAVSLVAPGGDAGSGASSPESTVLVPEGVASAAELVFTPAGGEPVSLWSFGEGCVTESADAGVEYRLGTSVGDAGDDMDVGIAAMVRSSGYSEVSVVVRSSPTEPEQLWVFSSEGAGSGTFDAEMDGSGFTADLVLADGAGGSATLVGAATCGR